VLRPPEAVHKDFISVLGQWNCLAKQNDSHQSAPFASRLFASGRDLDQTMETLAMSAACPLFGFVLQLRTDDVDALARLLSALRADVLEGRGLLLMDGEAANVYIVTGDGFQATDADREAVIAWLDTQPAAASYTVGALDDVGRAA